MDDFGKSDFDLWMQNPTTRWVMKKLATRFNMNNLILSAPKGETVDYYRGIAEVLECVLNPHMLEE